MKEAERYTKKLVARLIEAADLAEALLGHVLAHGLGTRMHSDLPRMLRELADLTCIDRTGRVAPPGRGPTCDALYGTVKVRPGAGRQIQRIPLTREASAVASEHLIQTAAANA